MLGLLVRDEWQWPFLDMNSSCIIPARDHDGFRTKSNHSSSPRVDLETENNIYRLANCLPQEKRSKCYFCVLDNFKWRKRTSKLINLVCPFSSFPWIFFSLLSVVHSLWVFRLVVQFMVANSLIFIVKSTLNIRVQRGRRKLFKTFFSLSFFFC